MNDDLYLSVLDVVLPSHIVAVVLKSRVVIMLMCHRNKLLTPLICVANYCLYFSKCSFFLLFSLNMFETVH